MLHLQNGGCVKRIILLIFLLVPSIVFAVSIPSVCHNELSAWIKANKALSIVDIQDDGEFREHNYERSLSTGNDPARLKKVANRLRTTNGKVIVVSTTGGEDAVKAVEQLVTAGVQRSRILILEGGMEAAAKNTACDCCKPASLQGVTK
jgi:rhodanese-related sulfurtransferase